MEPSARRRGLPLLVPTSQGATWDFIMGGYGPDVARINRALESVFDRCAVDKSRIAIGGFSDGASYAVSLGIANGDLFSSVLAFSPGFASPPEVRGWPRVFVSHGTRDSVLPIDRCSRPLVQRLRTAGYRISYHEFDGPHTIPQDLLERALDLVTPAP